MPTVILKRPLEVSNRLEQLGTSRELLLEVVDAVAAAKAECTENDPFGSRGWRGYQMGTRRSREVHIGLNDWEKDDTDQIPSIVSKRFGIRIVVCNTDDGTAIEETSPQNNSKKGNATERVVDANQPSLFEALEGSGTVVQLAPRLSVVTYYLCVYTEGDDRRAELSFPVEVENGFFHRFEERIFIIGGDTEEAEPIRRKSGDDEAEYPISVTRKK